MIGSRIGVQREKNQNNEVYQKKTEMENKQEKEIIGKVIFDYIKKEIEKGK